MVRTHVAILKRPYLRMILNGRKTVESRLTRSALPPFQAIAPGDRIYFKASSGPFMAYAQAREVVFYEDLRPADIVALHQCYNDLVFGEDAYWAFKSEARYGTFVLLEHVLPISVGPRIAPSRGPAWFVLNDEAAATAPQVITIALTAGAIRNNYLRIPGMRQGGSAFPQACFGSQRPRVLGEMITLELPDGRMIETDLVANGMFRWRGWGTYYQAGGAKAGDTVALVQIGALTYRVSLHRSASRPSLPRLPAGELTAVRSD